ncbi:unnamed protein product [Closterium sp. NIES-65]|nr:unnamed protein product [Closterium sp. NIES-65]
MRRSLKKGKRCKKGKKGKKCKKGKKGKKNASKAAAPGGAAPGAETPVDTGADSVGSDGAPGRSMVEVDQLPPLAEGDADADAADTRRSLKKGKKCKKGKKGKKCKKGKKGKKNASKAAAPGGTTPGAETPADAGADSVGSDGAPGRSMAEVDQLPPLAEGDADANAADTRRSLKKGKKCKKGEKGKKCKKGKKGKKCKKGKKGKKNASKAAAPGGTAPGAETPADGGADSVGCDGAPGRSMAEVDQFPPLAEGDADADAADTRRSLKKGKKCKKVKKVGSDGAPGRSIAEVDQLPPLAEGDADADAADTRRSLKKCEKREKHEKPRELNEKGGKREEGAKREEGKKH